MTEDEQLSPAAQAVLDALYKKGLSTALRELAAFCQSEMGEGDWHKTVDVESIYRIANELEGK